MDTTKTCLTAGGTTYEVVPHPFSPKHQLLKVTSKGRVYACVSALDETVKETTALMVRYLWKHDRHAFLPYNESLGTFSIPSKGGA